MPWAAVSEDEVGGRRGKVRKGIAGLQFGGHNKGIDTDCVNISTALENRREQLETWKWACRGSYLVVVRRGESLTAAVTEGQ